MTTNAKLTLNIISGSLRLWLRPIGGIFSGWLIEHTPWLGGVVVDGLNALHLSVGAEMLPAIGGALGFLTLFTNFFPYRDGDGT